MIDWFGWIEVKNLKTGKPVAVQTKHICTLAPALQGGNAYGYIELDNSTSIVTEESYDELKRMLEEP